jgi:hypothetical protein
MKKLVFIVLLLMGSLVWSQNLTKVYGVVNDQFGFGVSQADVLIRNSEITTLTDDNGQFEILVEPGYYQLNISAFGYQEINQTLSIKEGESIEINSQLKYIEDETTQLNEAVILGQINKESEATLLNLQKNSLTIQENIGVKELERKGVSDVASAVTKVSGISKQEGSSVIYVRGLGDRYNSTTLNGLPIPSNDPEFKNIDLSLFSTDILSYVGIDKVYNTQYFGDFAGGNINIHTKQHSGKGFLQLGMSSKINSNAISDKNFQLQSGINEFGFDKASNPRTLRNYAFENTLNPKKSGALGTGISFATGSRFKIGKEGKLSFYLTGAFDNDFTSLENGFLKSGVNAQGEVQGKDLTNYQVYLYSTHTNGFLNLNYQINPKQKINFNSLLVNTSAQKLEEGEGYMRDNANEGGLLRRGSFVQNLLWINQLLGEHSLNERLNLNWGIGLNSIQSDMPDHFQNILEWKSSLNHYVIANSSVSLNHRYFQELSEKEMVGNLALDWKFGKADENYRGKLILGYNGRMKTRDFEAMQYNLSPVGGMVFADFENLDAFYNVSNYESGLFQITTFSGKSLDPQFYQGEQNIQGAYLQLEYAFTPKLFAVLGLRGEFVEQKVEWNTSLDSLGAENSLEEFMFLPNLNLKYEWNSKQNVRFAVSKTYTLPQFKERALFMYEDLGETVYGWPTTYASTDYNADLKWEFFPKSGEIFSLTAFGKYIENPINKFTVASSTNDISYANTGDWGYVIGGELEIRKTIYQSDAENPIQITAGANLSYAHTNQELNNEKVFEETKLANGSRMNANFTQKEDKFQGASDWLANADVSFQKDWSKGRNLMMTLAYQYFSDRIYALGTDGRGNIVEKGLGTLDFILRSKIHQNLGFSFQAKNLLNPTYERLQENPDQKISVLGYKRGMNIQLGINFQF